MHHGKAAESFSEEPQEENKKRSRRNFKKWTYTN